MTSTLVNPPGLVVVCGPGRSGTTLIGALLSRSPAVEVFNETPHLSGFPSFSRLIDELRRWAGEASRNPHEAWRNVGPRFVAHGIRQLLAGYCRAFKPSPAEDSATRWDQVTKPAPRIVCLKRPEAEMEAESYERLFAALSPRYIYCIRDPRAIYSSLLAVNWGAELTPEACLEKLARSAAAIQTLAASPPPGRVYTVNVDVISADVSLRRRVVAEILRDLGLPLCREIDEFVAAWPPVNRAAQVYGTRRFVSEAEEQARLRRFTELLDDDARTERSIARLLAGGRLESPPLPLEERSS